MIAKPTKTFGVDSAMDIWIKLKFDLERLRAARWTRDQQYAALDCAIWSFHLVDWVLREVDDAARARLTAVKGKSNSTEGRFIETNDAIIPTLKLCRQIANTGKHRVLTRSPDDPSWGTGHSVRFNPPFDPTDPHLPTTITAQTYLKDNAGNEILAVNFFEAAVVQWEYLLKKERLFDWNWDYEPPDPTEADGDAAGADAQETEPE